MDSPEVPVANGWWPVGAILSTKARLIGIDSREKSRWQANDTFFIFLSKTFSPQ
ncbi:hypothetical protein [Rouxiella sp. WC2420]|uniref:Uncharacterized protein n=1 Tax=Rouxiella sp. WC2420 TaxID=3234145 RepID=A0AB39VN90_9GAMM